MGFFFSLDAQGLSDSDDFWFKVWRTLHQDPRIEKYFPEGTQFKDGDGFARAFSVSANGDKIILAWDEFDIYSRSDKRWAEILEKFRFLKGVMFDKGRADCLFRVSPPNFPLMSFPLCYLVCLLTGNNNLGSLPRWKNPCLVSRGRISIQLRLCSWTKRSAVQSRRHPAALC